MKLLNQVLDAGRSLVRAYMHRLARFLDRLSGGRLHPDTVTLIGLFAHAPIAYLIAVGINGWAAALLVVFGLFDALDGELARLQGRASNAGMLLDASTDRMKEVLLYTGVAYAFVRTDMAYASAWAVAALGASMCVSYVKAKGEVALSDRKLTANQRNKVFADGLLRFEVRMLLLVIGLLFNALLPVVVIIAILSTYTAFDRLVRISRQI